VTYTFTAQGVWSAVGPALAPLASPSFTGDPKAPTPATSDNDTSIATTAYVQANLTSEFVTSIASATLTTYRVLTDTATITWDRTTAGQIKANTAAGGGNVSNVGTPTNGQFAQWTTATTIQGISAAAAVTALGVAKDAFHAHRNGVNQTGFTAAFAKCGFGSELFDQNNKYDNVTNFRWTPAAGLVWLNATLTFISLAAGTGTIVALYKNGAIFKQVANAASSTTATDATAAVTSIDLANGTDYYECFGYVNGGVGTLLGTAQHTYFQGVQL